MSARLSDEVNSRTASPNRSEILGLLSEACAAKPYCRHLIAGSDLTIDAHMVRLHQCLKSASVMRTTINLEDDAYASAEAYARARALKLGQAISELIRLGSASRLQFKQVAGVWVFDLPQEAPRLSTQQVQSMLDEPT